MPLSVPESPIQPRTPRAAVLVPSLAVVLALLVGGAGLSRADHRGTPADATPAAAPGSVGTVPPAGLLPFHLAIADAAEQSLPAVVNISTTRTSRFSAQESFGPFFEDPFFRHFFGDRSDRRGMPRERRERSLGSGVLVTADGIVLTNNHVVDGADAIRITLSDEREFSATVVGSDAPSDIAVLRLDATDGETFPFLVLGDSEALRLGEMVIAVGNPFGLAGSVTMGIVSAKGRADVGIIDYEDFIQTDAAINPGNSGGALVNLRGELVGINTAIASRTGGYQGIGFAIPSNMAADIMERLVQDGRVHRGWLGIYIQDLDADMAESFGAKGQQGVLVSGVAGGSPAGKAGVQRGDVIVTFQGRKVSSAAGLRHLVALEGAGTRVALGVLRRGKRRSLNAKLGSIPGQDEEALAAEAEEPDELLQGLALAPLSAANRKRFAVLESTDVGLVVVSVEPGSPADEAGLRRGDVVIELDHEVLRSVKDLERIANRAGRRVLALIVRGEASFYVLVG